MGDQKTNRKHSVNTCFVVWVIWYLVVLGKMKWAKILNILISNSKGFFFHHFQLILSDDEMEVFEGSASKSPEGSQSQIDLDSEVEVPSDPADLKGLSDREIDSKSIDSIDSVCQVTNAEALFSIKQLTAYFQFGEYGDVLRTMEKSILRKLPSDRKSDSDSDTEESE